MSRFMVWVQFSISDSDPNPMNYVALYFRYDEGQCFCLIACILGFRKRRPTASPPKALTPPHISVCLRSSIFSRHLSSLLLNFTILLIIIVV